VAASHFVGTVIDVTEYREMLRQLWASRDSLRLLSARQEKLLEDERKRIAMELHDELGQLLTGIKMNNSAIQMRKADDPAVIKQTQRVEELAEKAIGVVRQVATSLRPLVLDMGLVAALSWQARNFQRMFGIPCELAIHCKDLPRNEHVEVTIFRVVQEALTNVSRHAAANQVWIEMDIEGDQLAVRIRDNGNGFDASSQIPGKTLGLLGQKERMHGLGGNITIESLPGTGTTVVLTMPIVPITLIDPTSPPHDHSASYH
jgi:signal transduction histidine kinase